MSTTVQAMAAEFTDISLADMDKFLKRAFRIMRPKRTTVRGELAYDLAVSENVMVRVYTSIGSSSSSAADVGSDAIRVGLFSSKTQRPLMSGKLPIVKRTQGWKANLQDRIEDAVETYEEKEGYWESRANPGGGGAKEDEKRPFQDEQEQDRDDRHLDLDDSEKEETPRRPPETLNGTFAMLKPADGGGWGVKTLGQAQSGDKVKAKRQSGQISWLTVDKVVWSGIERGTGNFVSYCTFRKGNG